MAKTQRFDGYSTDVERLATRIQAHLIENQFDVAFSKDQTEPTPMFFIQAKKRGLVRTVAGTRRSMDISIRGTPDSFEIRIGIGEWGNNLIVSAPLFVIPVVGITATAARIYITKRFEAKLWKHIKKQVELLRNTAIDKKTTKPRDKHEYDCDYMGGYPGWRSQVIGGKIILEKNPGTDRLIFEAPDGEQITIPATKIEKAVIISQKNGLDNDLMVEITCKDKDGNTINPVLSLSDDVITSVLIGINEIIDKGVQALAD